jgi:phage tail sheath protein FI
MGDSIPGVFVGDLPAGRRPIEAVGTSVAAFVGTVSSGPLEGAYIHRSTEYAQRWPIDSPLARAAEEYFRNGGFVAWVAPVAALRPLLVRRAIEAMDRDVTLVAVVSDPAAPADVIAAAAQAMARRRAMLLVEGRWPDADDAVSAMSADPAEAIGATGADVAVYWPRVRRSDGATDCSPLGAVAGVIARTDRTRGVSKAPAGSDAVLHGVTAPTAAATRAQQEELNGLGVNLIRDFAQLGTVLWGARTQSADREWRYVPVRRAFLFIEESISRGLQWVVFEPNGEPLWISVRLEVEAFLHGLFRDGVLAGTKPDHAYFVKCDGTTMTEDDIASGRLICLVGVALARPSEFVVFRIGQWTADAED